MKTKRFSRLALLMLAMAVMLCSAFGVAAGAEDAEFTAEIDTANVAYNDMVQLAFTIKTTGTIPEGTELGVMFWNADATEFNVENATYLTFTANEKDGTVYYKSNGIPAPEMDTAVYVAAVYKADGAITIAETPFKYSALQYAGTRLTEEGITAKQASLYIDLIDYGMSSDAVFENAENYAFVKANNGTIGSFGAKIGGWLDKTVLLRAEAKNAAGEYFIKWVDAAGADVSANRLAFVTVTTTGITEYTAIYGAKADSAYANTYDFEAIDTGKIKLNSAKLYMAPDQKAYNTSVYSLCWTGAVTYGNLQLSYSMPPVMKDGAPAVDENGYYSVAYTDSYFITESLNGDKEIYIDRLVCPQGYVNKFTNTAKEVAQAVELDVTLSSIERYGIANSFTFQIADSDGTAVDIRINLRCDEGNKLLKIQDQPSNTNNRHSFNGATDYLVDATYTIRAILHTDTASVEIVVNGVSYGSLPISNWGTWTAEKAESFTLDDATTIKYVSFNCESGGGNDLSIDNVTFLAN